MREKRFIIIDSNSLLHRAYHALPTLTTKKGEKISAIYGFLLVFFKIIKEFQPDFIAATFDFPAPTFRHKKFKEYKAKRPPIPKELASQFPKLKEILGTFNIPIFEKRSYEADDIIGTISKQIYPEVEAIILSGDLDTLQLINPHTKVYLLKKGIKNTILCNKKEVEKIYQGLLSKQITDFKALKGDPSDNIPGVSGIGSKTAIELIKEFKSLENLYKELEDNTERAKRVKPKIRELLIQQKEQAFLSKDLAIIKCDIPINFNLKDCRFGTYDKGKVIKIFENLGFTTLIKRLEEIKRENLKIF